MGDAWGVKAALHIVAAGNLNALYFRVVSAYRG